MRKIERLMNAAISEQREFRSANTAVVNADGISVVLLHGNKIAEVGDNWIQLFDGGWQTATTKSRLNAILREHGCPGDGVFQKKHEWFVTFTDIKNQKVTVPFFSGMRLN